MKHCKAFLIYFEKNWISKKLGWAAFLRKNCNGNTNSLENLNKNLKENVT